MYYVYILRCADTTLYTGVTTDLQRRLAEHNASPRGAKYTRARRPVRLVYSRRAKNRARAQQVEASLRRLTRLEKIRLIRRSRSS